MTELQLRLRQTGRYGAEADGSFDREVNAPWPLPVDPRREP
ncbi:hypothetical protein [Streptomyces sp. NPDC093990]